MDNFFLMKSPIQPAIIAVLYVIGVLKIGPAFMKNRRPFDLKPILVVYNMSQIVFNVVLLKNIIRHIPETGIMCQPVREINVTLQSTIMDLHHKYILLKIYDFLDTIFFVLRKKERQLSFLHIYHHLIIFLFSWGMGKYFPVSKNFPAGPSVFYGFWNTFVHSFMYAYYFLSVACAQYVKDVRWKKYVTLLQLVQHFSLLFLTLVALFDERCPYPRGIIVFVIVFAITIIYLFITFYQRTYGKNTKAIHSS